MIRKTLSIARDCVLFCILIALVQIAVNNNISFLLEHKKSLIHELDRDFIDQLYTAQRQLHAIENHPRYAFVNDHPYGQLKEQLTTIEEQYKKNSPALTLLGPIGTASIVMKEEQLNKKLLTITNTISELLHTSHNKTEPFQPSTTIDDALYNNKLMLKTIVV